MRILAYIFFVFVTVSSCSPPEEFLQTNFGDVVFGHFYGECLGDDCIQMYSMTTDDLFKDSAPSYPSRTSLYEGSFEKVDVSGIPNLSSGIPTELLLNKNQVFGCPDCVDQGGLYFEISDIDGERSFWIFDQDNDENPEYARALVDDINSAIQAIND